MSNSIFLLQPDNKLIDMHESAYDSEALLQELLASHPDLLAGDQIDSDQPRRWVLVSREMPVPDKVDGAGRWSLDHLFLDQDAIPTLVEVKRASDPRLRREVIGQILDYAANAVVFWPVDAIRIRFEQMAIARGENPSSVLNSMLGDSLDVESFWELVKTNLQLGRVRLILIADEISPEVRRIVEFLNGQMDPAEVLAIEVKQFKGGNGLTTLVPRVVGQTAVAEQKKSRYSAQKRDKRWDEDSFFAKLGERGNEVEYRVAKDLFSWSRKNLQEMGYGNGVKIASFIPFDRIGETWFCPFRVYTGNRAAYLEIPLGGAGMQAPPFDKPEQKLALVSRLNAISGITIGTELNRYPTFDLVKFADGERLNQFLKGIKWAVDQVRASNRAPTTANQDLKRPEIDEN